MTMALTHTINAQSLILPLHKHSPGLSKTWVETYVHKG